MGRNIEKYKKWLKKYRNENKEKFKKSFEKWRKSQKGRANKLLKSYNESDIEYNRGKGNLTSNWIIENIFSKPCHYCGETDWTKLGCNRLDNSKPHTKDNVEPCCYECNIKLSIDAKKKQVYQYTFDGKLVKIWESAKECGRNGFNQSAVCKCCNGGFMQKGKWINCYTYKGYKWSFKPL